jgi:uroporphyrinogen-III synthase
MMHDSLVNRTIVVTRGEEQAQAMLATIESLGGTAVWFPTVKISPIRDRSECESVARNLDEYDWIVFTSANAVRFFEEMTKRLSRDKADCRVVAVGKKTAEELEQRGVSVDIIPATFSARGVLESLEDSDVHKKRFLLPLSNIARDELREGLEAKGGKVKRIEVYRTDPNHEINGNSMQQMIERDEVDCLTFCSPSAFRFFTEIVGAKAVSRIIKRKIAVGAIGPTTSRAIEEAGIENIIMPRKSDVEELISAIVLYFATHLNGSAV